MTATRQGECKALRNMFWAGLLAAAVMGWGEAVQAQDGDDAATSSEESAEAGAGTPSEESAGADAATSSEEAADAATSSEEAADAEPGKPLAERGYALGDQVLGDGNAPVTVIEYLSLTCPHCAAFHADGLPQLQSEYIDTGKVKLVAREVYWSNVALLAGRIVRCGGEEGYFPLVARVFETLDSWSREPKPEDALVDVALRSGFPIDRLRSCLVDREFALHILEASRGQAELDGVESTPTFIVEGEVVTGAAWEPLREAIEGALP